MALNRNNLKQTPVPVVPRHLQIVNPDGTPTRSGQLLLEQLVPNVLAYGGSGGADTGMPDGSIYVVQGNNSEVLYQLQGGEWHYVAGTMWGTLNPDQRPTGLGPNDAGFDFRSIDSDPNYAPREFIWSGHLWVETTLVLYGTHAARPAANAQTPPRTIYVESDRVVTYQNQGSAWVYISGTMYGANLAARPTDLGPSDAGFLFFQNDTFQLWRWNGTAWADRTPANDAQIAYASAGLTLTTSMANIPGAAITLNRSGRYLLNGCFCFILTGDAGFGLSGQLVVNGVAQPGGALTTAAANAIINATQQWVVTAAAGQVALLQASKGGGAGTSQSFTSTSISALWIGP